jgi:hypothetical protein
MSRDSDREDPVKGDEYVLPDGSTEIVFLVEDGRVLTVREYESIDSFEESVAGGRYLGTREEVAAMPGVEAFGDPDPSADDAGD